MLTIEMNSQTYGRDVIAGNDGHGYATLQEVSEAYCEVRDFTGESVSTFGFGKVRDQHGQHIYTVSYNGRVWEADGALEHSVLVYDPAA